MCTLGGVVVTGELSAFVQEWLQKVVDESLPASFPNIPYNLLPHVGNDDDILECRVPAKLTECLEVAFSDPGEPLIGNSVEVNDPAELGAVPIPSQAWN